MKKYDLFLIISAVFLISGCSLRTVDRVQASNIKLQIAPVHHSYIRALKIRKDEKGFYVWGHVRPGRRSNVYRLYQGHIDITDRESDELILKISLGPRTERFIRRIDAATSDQLIATYYKEAHSKHMKQAPGISHENHSSFPRLQLSG